MARISAYTQDASVASDDKLIGTSSEGTTKTYTLSSIAKHFTDSNSVSIDGQKNMRFITDSNSLSDATFFLDNFAGDGTNLVDISSINISKNSFSGTDIETLLREMFEDKLKISSTVDPSAYAVFDTGDIIEHPTYSQFIQIPLSNGEGYGDLNSQENYSFVKPITGDRKYVHTQNSVSNQWTVTHNLNKYPSVSIVNSADVVVHGEVEYISKNQVRINFSGAFSGKAFFN